MTNGPIRFVAFEPGADGSLEVAWQSTVPIDGQRADETMLWLATFVSNGLVAPGWWLAADWGTPSVTVWHVDDDDVVGEATVDDLMGLVPNATVLEMLR